MKLLPSLLAVTFTTAAAADQGMLSVEATRPVAKVSPILYGLMTEEINHCYDGGLYAELVQNRAFLDNAQEPVHWQAAGGAVITLDPKQPLNAAIPTSLRVEASGTGCGVSNEGYWGIPVKPSTTYRASFFAKAGGGIGTPLTVSLQSADGATVYAKAVVPGITNAWKQYQVALTTAAGVTPTTEARLAITAQKPGTFWIGLVSLFPPTWKNRPNGLRPDLMQMLVDMKPKFLRFPGGNYLEGDTVDLRFPWKQTLGPLAERPGHQCPWGYRSSDGMGLMEFLLWCEDMGAEPVLGVYAGYNLKGSHVEPGPALEPFVQEALEEIEYVIGPTTTKWGARRAKDGHPAPFKLRYVEIGNEDWFDKSGSYDGRFAQFFDAIKRKYPQLKCISSVGFEQPKEKQVHSRKPDMIDEHYYTTADEFLKMSPGHYESYDRKGPEIFVGEWAAHETSFPPWDKRSHDAAPTPNMKAAIGDAAFMAAMERNSDIVVMQCYAPLFVNVNPGARQWRPNLIGYDALRSYGSPSYHAMAMFSTNLGDQILKVTPSGTPVQACATRDSRTGEIILKLVNPEPQAQPLKIDLKGLTSVNPAATAITLAADPAATNSIDEPRKVVPATSQVNGVKPAFEYPVPANGIVVLKIKTK